ncbi:MAG: TonB-dependent receptor [Bacteroidetes bacterium]|jgi:outer membrane receptor protein involved in Fe transport|nr:TonB-dependent receptor [Bacteroidota bacterium]
MLRKIALALFVLLLVPLVLLAQDGKLRGLVTDKESGEPLIGANVVVDGTSLGAASDVNGEYVILSVPPGTYTLKASYIGYAPVTISNVRVLSNLTTTQDIQMSSTAVQASEVVITAERPLIQRNTTNTVRVNTQENLASLPVRGLQNIVALEAGVVERNGNLYVRGGRAGEVGYTIDGTNVTNPFFNSSNVNVIQEAIEEVQVQAGGFTAEYGGAMSGLVRTTTRTGGTKYQFTLDAQTDDFAKPGEEFLGTSSRGYRNVVVTAGGPIVSNDIRFFVAGQHNYFRNRQSTFIEPFKFAGLTQDALGSRGPSVEGTLLPFGGDIEYKKNYLYDNSFESNQLQGTLLLDFNPFKVKLTGSYELSSNPNGGGWPGGLANYFRSQSRQVTMPDGSTRVTRRYSTSETTRLLAGARLTHVLSPSTFYEVGVSYQDRFAETFDPEFKGTTFADWLKYPDSLENAKLGYGGWRSRYSTPFAYSAIQQFLFAHEDAPNNAYAKNQQSAIIANVAFTSQINTNWELKAGGQIETWTIRSYNFGNIAGYLKFMDSNEDGIIDRTFANPLEERTFVNNAGVIATVGYDNYGVEVDDGVNAPGEPFLASAYVQNKFEYQDLILNVGVRYELIDPKAVSVPKQLNPATNQFDYQNLDAIWDYTYETFQEDKLTKTDAFQLLLPRISFSFPVTDRTVFYALYGKYAQLPSLNLMYQDNITMSSLLDPLSRVGYNIGGATIGFLIRPERLTQYEIGLRQTLTDNFALTVTGFYKDTRDQIQIARLFNSSGVPMSTAYQNEDFGTQKGVEMTLELRRTNRLAAKVNYTLSDARGTASSNRSSQNSVTDEASSLFPRFVYPLDQNQTHKGSILLDYRWGKGEGGMLEGLGVNLLTTFNSGHNYTKIQEPQNLGQATAWNVGVRALIDSRTRVPVEPVNTSATPWVFNVDMNISKMFYLDFVNLEIYARVLNLFNAKSVLNVYPTTGTPNDDGWLKSPFAVSYKAIPNYEAWYKAVNLANRHAYMSVGGGGGLGQQGGNDLFGSPREIRIGMKLEL